MYQDDGRSAYNSINFITCHDGFTLHDLVSYNGKHNDANLEHNSDGTDDNNSWNWGTEGETSDVAITALRKQLARNYICMLFFSMGTPMLLGGDEFMRTQRGNNNAYCLDNDISWFDWNAVEKNADILEFCRKTIAFTKKYTVLQHRKVFEGKDRDTDGVPDISWFDANLSHPQWDDREARLLCYRLDGGEVPSDLGRYFPDFNQRCVAIPSVPDGMRWHRVIDTSLPSGDDFLETGREIVLDPSDFYLVNSRSTVLLLGR